MVAFPVLGRRHGLVTPPFPTWSVALDGSSIVIDDTPVANDLQLHYVVGIDSAGYVDAEERGSGTGRFGVAA